MVQPGLEWWGGLALTYPKTRRCLAWWGQSTSWCQLLGFGRNQPWAIRRSLEIEVRSLKGVKVFHPFLVTSYEMPLLNWLLVRDSGIIPAAWKWAVAFQLQCIKGALNRPCPLSAAPVLAGWGEAEAYQSFLSWLPRSEPKDFWPLDWGSDILFFKGSVVVGECKCVCM